MLAKRAKNDPGTDGAGHLSIKSVVSRNSIARATCSGMRSRSIWPSAATMVKMSSPADVEVSMPGPRVRSPISRFLKSCSSAVSCVVDRPSRDSSGA